MWAKTKDQHEIVMKTLPNQRLARGECYNMGKVFMFPLWAVWLEIGLSSCKITVRRSVSSLCTLLLLPYWSLSKWCLVSSDLQC